MAAASAKTAVVYFSATGNTERLAKTTALALGADIFEIKPETPYTSADLNWNNKNSRCSKENDDKKSRPAISGKIDLSAYDTIVLAYPIWWGLAPKIVYTFVETHDLSGKTIIPICTSGGSGLGTSGSDLAKYASKSAKFANGKAFSSRTSEAEIKKFFDNIK